MAEDEGKELNYKINVTGSENVAKAAAKYGATLVYISTDYVFNGELPVGQEWQVMTNQIRNLNTVVPSVWVRKRLKVCRQVLHSAYGLGLW